MDKANRGQAQCVCLWLASLIFLLVGLGTFVSANAESLIPEDPQVISQVAQQATKKSGDTTSFDFSAPPKTKILLAPGLTFGADVEVDFESERNFDLDSDEDDGLSTVEPALDLAFSYDPTDWFRVFAEVELSHDVAIEAPAKRREREPALKIKKAYVTLQNILDGVTLQLGRQRVKDEREWLYDEELDAARLFVQHGNFGLEASASRRLLVQEDLLNKDRKERINNYFFLGRYALSDDSELDGYFLVRDDLTSSEEDLYFIGLRSIGEIAKDWDYWLDGAYLTGTDGSDDINAFGFDVGTTYVADLPWEPSLTLGFAFGSGDSDPDDGTDYAYRQTGLQDNNGRFNGVTRFKYYGEVLDPELSNLAVLTAGIGIRPSKKSSIDLVYHSYWQHKATDRLRDAEIEMDPDGRSRYLGHGLDLVVGFREFEDVDAELILGGFFPRDAFPDDADNAYFVGFEIQYSF